MGTRREEKRIDESLSDWQNGAYYGRSREDAEREVNRLEIAARLLPNEINAFGAVPVPSVMVEPEVKVEPIIKISTDDQDSDYDAAMRSSAAMSGNQAVLGRTE